MFSVSYNIPRDKDFSLHPRSLVFSCFLLSSFSLPAVWASQLWDGTDISPQRAARTDHLHAYYTSAADRPWKRIYTEKDISENLAGKLNIFFIKMAKYSNKDLKDSKYE